MRVHVFILEAGNDSRPSLLVLPDLPRTAIPPHLLAANWQYFFSTSTDDDIIGDAAALIESLIESNGYVLFVSTKDTD